MTENLRTTKYAEWTVLKDYLAANGHSGTAGTVLKSTSG
jgi:hypothetical protein|tara:strand:- start:556 stop:672 length:117 start_codon:yes stop_codon:yes gene_type:complete